MKLKIHEAEVILVAAEEATPLASLARQIREDVTREMEAQAAQLELLEQSLQRLREQQAQFKARLDPQLDVLEASAASPAEVSSERLLAAVRNLIVATLPQQVFDALCEEAEQMGARAAAFEVRGKSAWGSSARGFGVMLPTETFRRLAVSLTQANLFRQVVETGAHVQGGPELLKKNRNVMDGLKPAAADTVVLIPIRSAGAVSAILYADTGGKAAALPVDAVRILAEFAGAQLDRLMALSGGIPAEAVVGDAAVAEPIPADSAATEETAKVEPVDGTAELEVAVAPEPEVVGPDFELTPPVPEPEPAPEEDIPPPSEPTEPTGPPPLIAAAEAATPAGAPAAVETPTEPAPAEATIAAPAAESAPPPPVAPELSEEEQKIHRDAKRFARLLVSEIELYNKAKVADGRKNKDLYRRLKRDVDRSRQTYDKRFSKVLPRQFDYFHEELVRSLANNDPSVLGADYPGPAA